MRAVQRCLPKRRQQLLGALASVDLVSSGGASCSLVFPSGCEREDVAAADLKVLEEKLLLDCSLNSIVNEVSLVNFFLLILRDNRLMNPHSN